MKYLLGLLVILNVADAVLTHFLIDLGLATEGNYLLKHLADQPYFIIIKLLGALAAVFILRDVYKRYPVPALAVTSLFVAIYGVIVLWNTSLFPIYFLQGR